ncbi:MAG: Protein translocase subunit SecA [Candidatus Uhrbacteria bacterium GW2011_GWE2_45_35]|uniref:Protein translocase subunit SecA n=2 Tax=Candidatus Uhriibacteriota TaxID=1752732 RepID=A0A0G1JJ68_9BACT|nr:MAG: Protein translocase subunit SecA [Candidatus Uhrbacteria bacterium GW2011_GWF2_44_350]KKU08648.1 MAG: Protein translocase subunit SecA [Candidatus Uhrbacteria bacterium GW2011_GWE2_45_35]HBR80299.1 preprotein translocase subunit SecA [Candidatus Uhrbacteria bacterium]HCU31601.1 preprotein translocase subunit SecA [Candidatus Uhrbacteria bacterium]
MNIFNTIFGDPNEKVLNQLQKQVEAINALETSFKNLSDEALKNKSIEFKERLKNGESLDDFLPEAFAAVREVSLRVLGQRHYDVQLIGGIAMHLGHIAEMRTGEGKTLAATAPLYLNALEGRGCHLITVNDYLAKRDSVWMGQIYYALGLSVGCIQHDQAFVYDPAFKHAEGLETSEVHDKDRDATGSFRVHTDYLRPCSRREAYEADITYGTNNEFGFDFLRDNMVYTFKQMAQRPLHYAIVDEVDSILIDEARTPLIISAPAEESNDMYMRFAVAVKFLKENEDYNIDEKMRSAALTAEGIAKLEKDLGIENIYAGTGAEAHHAEQALRAHALYRLDRDYVVKDGEVIIVDEFTGRLMEGRRYSEGLHQAIEAKEGVQIQRESETLATITFQNYFRMYKKLAGMTGTAATEAEEFGKIYNLEVTVIPTNQDPHRNDLTDRVYKNETGKLMAVAREVKALQQKGQPVLLGTVSIEKNELLSQLLDREGVKHNVLNAKNHEREAEIIAQAGRAGSVTLATNMAGRGVDIVLGGNPKDPAEAAKVKELGGLIVIGTERHESRRIDNQLRGRSGRQGDPGATQFYVSMEDDLMRIFGSDRVKNMMDKLGIPDDTPIENSLVTSSIEKAQHRVEGHHFDVRKHLLEYDDVLNKHREILYGRRREVVAAFENQDPEVLKEKIIEIIEDEIEQVVMFHTGQVDNKKNGDWDPKEILEVVSTMIPLSPAARKNIEETAFGEAKEKLALASGRTQLIETVVDSAREAYKIVEDKTADPAMTDLSKSGRVRLKELERNVILRAIDRLWINHLSSMTELRTGIGLRGYGQQDPLVEYKKEAFRMFNQLLTSINQEVAYSFFKVAVHAIQVQQATLQGKTLFERAGAVIASTKPGTSAAVATSSGAPGVAQKQVGRNEPCPCGSGVKFKRCHGK